MVASCDCREIRGVGVCGNVERSVCDDHIGVSPEHLFFTFPAGTAEVGRAQERVNDEFNVAIVFTDFESVTVFRECFIADNDVFFYAVDVLECDGLGE